MDRGSGVSSLPAARLVGRFLVAFLSYFRRAHPAQIFAGRVVPHNDVGGAMYEPFGPESRRDLIRRGFSRRDFGRLAAF